MQGLRMGGAMPAILLEGHTPQNAPMHGLLPPKPTEMPSGHRAGPVTR